MKKNKSIKYTVSGFIISIIGVMSVNIGKYWLSVSLICFLSGVVLLMTGMCTAFSDAEYDEDDEMFGSFKDEAFIDDSFYKDELQEQESWKDTYKLAKRIEYREHLKEECEKDCG